MTKTLVLLDMRAPEFGAAPRKLYEAALEIAAYSDSIGIDRLLCAEHHGSEDGYLPAPFVLGGALAAVTRRSRILLSAVLVPLHDPAKLAEQIAVLDLVSGGRLEAVLGAGYVPGEFARFGVDIKKRGKLLDEGIEVILRALSGERFHFNGREVFVRPLPLQKPHPIFYVGGGVPAAARRAAHFKLGFSPMHEGLWEAYTAELEARGQSSGPRLGWGGPISVFVAEDPDKAWAEVVPHMLHAANSYVDWANQSKDPGSNYSQPLDASSIRAAGRHRIVTPDECVKLAAEIPADSSLVLQPLIGGLDPAIGIESIRLFGEKVMPRLKRPPESSNSS